MYKTIIDYIADIAHRHILVNKVKYQSSSLINQQHSNANYEVIIEDNAYFQWIKTSNVFTLTLNIDVLSHVSSKMDGGELRIHDEAFLIINNILKYIEADPLYKGILSIYDYSIMDISHFTDDNSAGGRLSLELAVPNPVTFCNYMDNFGEPTQEEPDKEITLPTEEEKDLDLKPITLPKNKKTRAKK